MEYLERQHVRPDFIERYKKTGSVTFTPEERKLIKKAEMLNLGSKARFADAKPIVEEPTASVDDDFDYDLDWSIDIDKPEQKPTPSDQQDYTEEQPEEPSFLSPSWEEIQESDKREDDITQLIENNEDAKRFYKERLAEHERSSDSMVPESDARHDVFLKYLYNGNGEDLTDKEFFDMGTFRGSVSPIDWDDIGMAEANEATIESASLLRQIAENTKKDEEPQTQQSVYDSLAPESIEGSIH